MKLLFDLLPVILFFVVFKWGDAHPDQAYELATQLLSGLVAGHAVVKGQSPILLATILRRWATCNR